MEARTSQSDGRRTVIAHARDFFRWLFLLLLVSACLSLAGLHWIQSHLDEEIRRHIEAKFREHYVDLAVSIKSARRLRQGGIEIRGLSIAQPRGPAQPQLLAHVDELRIDCDTRVDQLLSADRVVRQLLVRNLVVNATCQADGSWSVSQLLPLPKFGSRPPPAVIESGLIKIQDQRGDADRRIVLRDVDLQVKPTTPAAGDEAGRQLPILAIAGNFVADSVARIECHGEFDLSRNRWSVSGRARQVRISPDLFTRLPGVGSELPGVNRLHGTAEFEYRLSSPSAGETPFRFRITEGRFEGQVDDPRLPRPLRDVQLAFACDNSALTIDRAVARYGESELTGSCYRGGWSSTSPCDVELTAKNFHVDQPLRNALPPDWQRKWDRFAPQGVINASAVFRFDGSRWRHFVTLDCLDGSFAYEKFPYRLSSVQGTIVCRDEQVEIGSAQRKLRGLAGGKWVEFLGHIERPGTDNVGWIEMQTTAPISLDERLIAAVPDVDRQLRPHATSPRDFVRSLQPRGKFAISARYERHEPGAPFEKHLVLELLGCSIRYEKFLYPIHGIRGHLVMENDRWRALGLQGDNDSARIVCNGHWHPDGGGGIDLRLNFEAWDVPLEEELRDALKPSAQQIWRQLRPRGTIDWLQVALAYRSASGSLETRVWANKGPASQNVEGRSISVTPTWLPYQLDEVTGVFEMVDGVAKLTDVRAWHGGAEFGMTGEADRPAADVWRLNLKRVYADRIRVSHELVAALPGPWATAISKLNPQGPLSLSGSLELSGRQGVQRPSSSRWDLTLDVEDGSLECGTRFDHLRGDVRLYGHHDPSGVFGQGLLTIDSVVIKGVQLTNVRGPLAFQHDRLMFGASAQQLTGERSLPITAQTFGGLLANSGQIVFSDSSFYLQTSLQGGDLSTISREATSGRHVLSGQTFGEVQLTGTGRGVHTLRGEGAVQLRDANIAELPLLVRLLKLLRVKDPDETAFTSSDLEFHLEGDRIYFDRIDFDGDAISLEGRGELGFDQKLNLTFDPSVGRDDRNLISQLFRPILKEAGRRLASIRVTGTLQDPQADPVPLPELNEGIQHVFPETTLAPRSARPR